MFKKISGVLLVPAAMVSALFIASCAGEDGENGAAGASCAVVTEEVPEGSDFGIKCGEGDVQWVMNGEQGLPGDGCVTVTEDVPVSYDVGVKCGDSDIVWVTLNGDGFDAQYLGIMPGDTKAELGFNWYSKIGEKAQVALFDMSGNLISTTDGSSTLGLLGNIYHKVTVEDLAANTEYQYSVSNDGEDWSKKYSFKTAADGNFTFALTGDTQLTTGNQDAGSAIAGYSGRTTASGWAEVIAEMEKANVAFIVSAGDQVDRNNNDQATEDQYVGLFAPKQMKKLPFAPVRGNHEESSHLFDHHYNFPNEVAASALYGRGTGTAPTVTAKNYYFLYNNVLFVGLNTSPYPGSSSQSAVDAYIADYEATINAAKAEYPTYDWLVVWHHKSTASVAGHTYDTDIANYVEAGFQQLMTDEEVDVVFAGHDHIYVRSKPMTGDHPNSISNPGYKTTYFTVNTGSGLKYYEEEPNDVITTAYPFFNQEIANIVGYFPESMLKRSQTLKPGWSIIDVTPTTFAIKSYELKTALPIDDFIIEK